MKVVDLVYLVEVKKIELTLPGELYLFHLYKVNKVNNFPMHHSQRTDNTS